MAFPVPPNLAKLDPKKCAKCKSTRFERKAGEPDWDENGWFQTVTISCSNGHETTERIAIVQGASQGERRPFD